jgi:hypothetical protein
LTALERNPAVRRFGYAEYPKRRLFLRIRTRLLDKI